MANDKILLLGDSAIAGAYVGFARKKAKLARKKRLNQGVSVLQTRYSLQDANVEIKVSEQHTRITIEGLGGYNFWVWDQSPTNDYELSGYGLLMPNSITANTLSVKLRPVFQNVHRGDSYFSDPDEDHFCFDPSDPGRLTSELAMFNPGTTQGALLIGYYIQDPWSPSTSYPYWKCSEYEKYDSRKAYDLVRGSGFPTQFFVPSYISNQFRYQPDKTLLYNAWTYWSTGYYTNQYNPTNNTWNGGYSAYPRCAYLTRTDRAFFGPVDFDENNNPILVPPLEMEFPIAAWDHNEMTICNVIDDHNRLIYSNIYNLDESEGGWYSVIIRTSLTKYEQYKKGELSLIDYNAQIEIIDYDETPLNSGTYAYYFPVLAEPNSLNQTNAYLATDYNGNDRWFYFYVEEQGTYVEKHVFPWTLYTQLLAEGYSHYLPHEMFVKTMVSVSPTEFYWATVLKDAASGATRWALITKIEEITPEDGEPYWEATLDKIYQVAGPYTSNHIGINMELIDRFAFVWFSPYDGEVTMRAYDIVTKQDINLSENAYYNGVNLRNLIPGAPSPRFTGYTGVVAPIPEEN